LHEYVDSFLAHLLFVVAGGKSFGAPSYHDLMVAISKATGTRKGIVESAIIQPGENPQVFRILGDTKSDRLVLDINPALSWEMLLSYPKTRKVCDKLLGNAEAS